MNKNKSNSVCVMEPVEGRVLYSTTPVFGQNPPAIFWRAYSQESTTPRYGHGVIPPSKVQPPKAQPPKALPPVVETPIVNTPVVPAPVAPVLADAPEGLKARAAKHSCCIALKWKSVDPSAKTIVVESSTDGEHFSTIAMLDCDDTCYGAQNLNRSKTYTFRVYTLNDSNVASKVAEVEAPWKCKK